MIPLASPRACAHCGCMFESTCPAQQFCGDACKAANADSCSSCGATPDQPCSRECRIGRDMAEDRAEYEAWHNADALRGRW